MFPYLAAKSVEYRTVLAWATREVTSLTRHLQPDRPVLGALMRRLEEAQRRLHLLEIVVQSAAPALAGRGLTLVHELELDSIVLAYHYIPALVAEGQQERYFRSLLLDVAKRCGLEWVDDIVVRLDGPHATLPVFTERPILVAPPHQVETLLDFPGLYHELGHVVFSRFPNIADTLSEVVDRYYLSAGPSAGPLTPEQRVERERWIREAIDYWSSYRLDELFCDVFATFVCGPAHYYSCVDLALRLRDDPFELDETDEHPPPAARVRACMLSLVPHHQRAQTCRLLTQLWENHIGSRTPGARYGRVCPDPLIDQLAQACLRAIQRHLPAARPYDAVLSLGGTTPPVHKNMTLEEVLNAATVLLLNNPTGYAEWEQLAIASLTS